MRSPVCFVDTLMEQNPVMQRSVVLREPANCDQEKNFEKTKKVFAK